MKKKVASLIIALILVLILPFSVAAQQGLQGTMSSLVETTAKAALLVSLDTGDILYEKNIDKKVYPASITKIMTVTLMLESDRYQPDGILEMTQDVEPYIIGTGSAVSNLRVGEQLTQRDLTYLILMSSFGDCAYLGALYYGDTVEHFVKMMNDKAAALGLTGTHYGNPVGLHDAETYTTVRDICALTKYALKNKTFKTICETNKYTMPATNLHGQRYLSSTNLLMDPNSNCYYPYAAGVKTGFTDEAGRCLVSTASYNGMHYLCILMGCPSNGGHHFSDTVSFYRTAFSNFGLRTVGANDEMIGEMKVNLAKDTDHVGLYPKEGYQVLLPLDADDSTVGFEIHLNEESVNAPIKKGEVLGTADIIFANERHGTIELVAGEDVALSRWAKLLDDVNKFLKAFGRIILYIVIVIVVAAIVLGISIYKLNHKKKRKIKYIPYHDEEE